MTKIIIADDDASTRLLLSKSLVSKGYEVVSFKNGQEVLDNYTKIKPDVVLLDVEMPVLSGIETCIELRKRKDAFNLPIAIISSRDNEDDIVKGLTCGADEYILKPIRRNEILSKVSLLLSKKKAALGNISSNSMFAGKYKIIKTLGNGGFSIVYLAEDISNNRNKVALKVLDSKNLQQKHISQFLREAYGLSLLNHENIVKLIDFGSFAEQYYIVTEFIDGKSFNDIIENSPVSEDFASYVGLALVKALAYMSTHRIIHRDIKPDNILITDSGRVVLIDFGLSKDQQQNTLSNVDEMQGTPHFMSPEYIRDEDLDIECDIYSLGVTLFFAVTGEYPFNGTSMHIVQEHINTKPPHLHKKSSHISKDFSHMVDKMLHKKPKKRISLAMLADLLYQFKNPERIDPVFTDIKKKAKMDQAQLEFASLQYHQKPTPGKISIDLTKSCNTQEELSLAYSPGVAIPCMKIHKNIENVWKYTVKSNFIAVVSDGTAVLGLGNIGPEAGMPVMEGKAVLFKSFADIDTVPICLGNVFDENGKSDPKAIIETVKRLEPTFGGINLEDIGAPACFEVEQTLKKMMSIPVFHDDQHGTAIISLAGIKNALKMTGKKLKDCKIVVNGAGAAGIACSEFYISAGAKRENFLMCDSKGVIYKGREGKLTKEKKQFVAETDARTLADAMVGADIFLGLSVPGAVTSEMVQSMNSDSIIFAMANPTPEIFPDIAIAAGAKIVGTGRTDFPNQVNNVLGFPGIFRGALDVRASNINEEMKIAAATALAELVNEPIPADIYEILSEAYPEDAENGMFDGKTPLKDSFVIPKPFDPRVVPRVAKYVAEAAMKSGVAQIAIDDLDEYEDEVTFRLKN